LGAESEAETVFQRAIEGGRRQICGWFTEWFDTPDLKEARALLEALSV